MTLRYEVTIGRDALADLEALYDYMEAHRSSEHAVALIDDLLKQIDTLSTLPLRGAVPRELGALGIGAYRQVARRPYRIFYEIVDQRVTVLLVADGRRDMQTLLSARLLNR